MITSIDEAIKDPRIRRDILKKFRARCETLDVPPNPLVKITTPCILCSGHRTPNGYKMFNARNKTLGYSVRVGAHIVAFLLFEGERGDSQVQHLCGVKYCANHEHLTLGGPKENGEHASKTRAKSMPDNKTWKLSEPDRLEIKTLYYVDGYPIELLCDMFEVGKSTIYRVLNN